MSKYTTESFVVWTLVTEKSGFGILDPDGSVMDSGSLDTTISGLNGFLDRFQYARNSSRGVGTGTHSPWISHLLGGSRVPCPCR